jgi:prepilin-type N-terminal cleavage/methylation domain-containing protein
MRIKSKRRAGFTLVEIMIVTSLIGLLSTLAVPAAVRARDRAALGTIQSHLRVIEDSKALWATESRSGIGALPPPTELESYIKGNRLPRSVAGETYAVNTIGSPATATLTYAVGGLPAGEVITLE